MTDGIISKARDVVRSVFLGDQPAVDVVGVDIFRAMIGGAFDAGQDHPGEIARGVVLVLGSVAFGVGLKLGAAGAIVSGGYRRPIVKDGFGDAAEEIVHIAGLVTGGIGDAVLAA